MKGNGGFRRPRGYGLREGRYSAAESAPLGIPSTTYSSAFGGGPCGRPEGAARGAEKKDDRPVSLGWFKTPLHSGRFDYGRSRPPPRCTGLLCPVGV